MIALVMAALLAQGLEFQTVAEGRVLGRFDRCPGTNEARRAALIEMFREAGCEARELAVKGSPPNVVCTLKGQSDETILVGAHYDKVERGGGCADNWSGASMLASLYEGLKSRPRFHTFTLVGFTDEELGLLGSQAYAKAMSKEDVARTAAMINLDTLGLTPTKVWMSTGDAGLQDALLRLGSAMKLPVDGVNIDGVGTTDSESFRARGIASITIHSVTQETMPILHTVRDQLGAVDRAHLYQTYKLMTAYLAYLDGKLRPLAAPERLESLKVERTIALDAALDHVQGVDVEGGRAWVSSVDRAAKKGWLHVFDLATGKSTARTEVQNGKMFHPGGIALDGDFVWVPVAEYDRGGPTLIQKRDKSTLALVSEFKVKDHIGCVTRAGAVLMGGNWDAKQIYTWAPDGRELIRRDNTFATRYQDVKFADGMLVASGLRGNDEGAIEWLDVDLLRPLRRIEVGKTDRGVVFTHEGMAVRDGKLYLLPEDGPSRLFIFDLGK